MDPAIGNKKINKVNQAVKIQEHCLEWFHTTKPAERKGDCFDSYNNIFRTLKKISNDKKSNFASTAKSAVEYVNALEKHGERPELTEAKQVIKNLKTKAAEGQINPPDMWKQTKEIQEKVNKHKLCNIWAAFSKSKEEEFDRMKDCYYDSNSTYRNLQDTLNKFRK